MDGAGVQLPHGDYSLQLIIGSIPTVGLSPSTVATGHMVYTDLVVPSTRYWSMANPYVDSQVVEVWYVPADG